MLMLKYTFFLYWLYFIELYVLYKLCKVIPGLQQAYKLPTSTNSLTCIGCNMLWYLLYKLCKVMPGLHMM